MKGWAAGGPLRAHSYRAATVLRTRATDSRRQAVPRRVRYARSFRLAAILRMALPSLRNISASVGLLCGIRFQVLAVGRQPGTEWNVTSPLSAIALVV